MVRLHSSGWITALATGCLLALPSGDAAAQCQQRGMQGGGGMNMMQGQRGMGGGMNMMQGHRGGPGGGMAMMQGQGGGQGGGMQMQQLQQLQQLQALQQQQVQGAQLGQGAQALQQRILLIRALQQQNNAPALRALLGG